MNVPICFVLLIACATSAPLTEVPEEDAVAKYELRLKQDVKFGNLKVYVHINETVELRCMVDAEHFDLSTLMLTGPKQKMLKNVLKSPDGTMLSLKIDHFKKATNRGEYECSARTKNERFRSRLFVVEYMEHVVTETCKLQCRNGGTCLKDPSGTESCQCRPDWIGQQCDQQHIIDHVVQGLPNKWFGLIVVLTAAVLLLAALICCMKHRSNKTISSHKSKLERQNTEMEENKHIIQRCHTLMRQKNVSIPEDLDRRLSKLVDIEVEPVEDICKLNLNGRHKPLNNGLFAKQTDESVPLNTFAA
uniref:EGF-like domain-containing protein n=1 Tax=Steinernema glaseri TaxID=37863 RepID=A0A1I8A0F9_9BILA